MHPEIKKLLEDHRKQVERKKRGIKQENDDGKSMDKSTNSTIQGGNQLSHTSKSDYDILNIDLDKIDIQEKEIILSKGVTVVDPKKFMRSHLGVVRAHYGNRTYQPYLDRLKLLLAN